MSSVRQRSGAGTKSAGAVEPAGGVPNEAANNGTSAATIVLKLATAVGCGVAFGTAIHKCGVYDATVLRNQFNFSDNTMLQAFLSASGTSIAVLSGMLLVPGLRKYVVATEQPYRVELSLPVTIFGASLIGLGMVVAGACPGTIWVALGSGSLAAKYTVAGGITAGVVHGVLHDKYLAKRVFADDVPKEKASVRDLVKSNSTKALVGFGFAAAMGMMVYAVNQLSGSTVPLLPSSFNQPRWHAAFSGMLIGSLQLPLSIALSKNVGSASTMQTLASVFFMGTDKYPLLNQMKYGIHRWWQVLYLIAAAGSAAAVTVMAKEQWYSGTDVSSLAAFTGGFVSILGARLAGGCTSGHGISGVGHLMWRSFAAVVGMFGGAILARAVATKGLSLSL